MATVSSKLGSMRHAEKSTAQFWSRLSPSLSSPLRAPDRAIPASLIMFPICWGSSTYVWDASHHMRTIW
eukprot:840108-Karenia_brevis.AAC.1